MWVKQSALTWTHLLERWHLGRRAIPNFLAAIILFMAMPASAVSPGEEEPDKPWHISADEIQHDKTTNTYIANGKVVIEKPGRRLTADHIEYHAGQNTAIAEGKVVMVVNEDVLSGDRMEFDLKSETGVVYNGTVFVKDSHFYIRGKKIEKTGPASYAGKSASFSTCDGDWPDWSIHGSDVKVTVEGYGLATNATFQIKDIPTLYSPVLFFPAKRDRQTGFLFPGVGYSDRNGFEYNQPFYWAISENTDATVYLDYIEERGEKIGTEFRYVTSDTSKGTIMYDFLRDQKVEDGSPEATRKWGYDYDRYLRTSEDRYWLRAKADQDFPFGFTGKLDLDIVSDQDYLREFKTGMIGFDNTREYFLRAFGRDMTDYDSLTEGRENILVLNKSWSNYRFSTGFLWEDFPVYREHEELTDTTLQRLPFASFVGSKQPVLNSPIYWTLKTKYDYYYREDGNQVYNILRSHRGDLYPKTYLPLNFKNYFTLEPFFGLRETLWKVDEYEVGIERDETEFTRSIYDTGAGLSSEFYSVFNTQTGSLEKIKHIVKPFVGYTYIQDKDQTDLPHLMKDNAGDENDDDDRIDHKNQVLYSLTNTWIAKIKKSPSARISAAKSEDDMYEYRQIIRLYAEQRYDIDQANDDTIDDGEPFSPVYGRIDIDPFKYLTMKGSAEYNYHIPEFNSYNYGIGLSDVRGDSIYGEHRYRIKHTDRKGIHWDAGESLYLQAILKVTSQFSLYGLIDKDLLDETSVEQGGGLLFQSACWSMNLGYREEDDTKKIMVMFNLFGLGEVESYFDRVGFGN
jgi:LPS-assembly protein